MKRAGNIIATMSEAPEAQDLPAFNRLLACTKTLLRKHIEKEEPGAFVMADKVLDESQQDDMFEKFEQYEESIIGHGVHEELHAMIDSWGQGVPDKELRVVDGMLHRTIV